MSDGPNTQRLTHEEQRDLSQRSPLDERTLEVVVQRLRLHEQWIDTDYGGIRGIEWAADEVEKMLVHLRQGRCR